MTKENQKQLVSVLLTTRTIREAAEISGVSERTIRRHLHDENFLELYRELQEEIVEKNNAYIQSKVHTALDVLIDIIEAPETTTNNKIKAIDVLLNHSFKYAGMTKEAAEKREEEEAKKELWPF